MAEGKTDLLDIIQILSKIDVDGYTTIDDKRYACIVRGSWDAYEKWLKEIINILKEMVRGEREMVRGLQKEEPKEPEDKTQKRLDAIGD